MSGGFAPGKIYLESVLLMSETGVPVFFITLFGDMLHFVVKLNSGVPKNTTKQEMRIWEKRYLIKR